MFGQRQDTREDSTRATKQRCHHTPAGEAANCTAAKRDMDPDELAEIACYMLTRLTLDQDMGQPPCCSRAYHVPDLPNNISGLLYDIDPPPNSIVVADPVKHLQHVVDVMFNYPPALLMRADISGRNKAAFVFMVILIKCDKLAWQQAVMLLPVVSTASAVHLLSFFHGTVRQMYAASIMIRWVHSLQESPETKRVLLMVAQQYIAHFVRVKGEQPWM